MLEVDQINPSVLSILIWPLSFRWRRLSILRGGIQSGSPVVALEYEKTAKSNWRYNKAIKAYSDSGEFSFVLFVVESDGIENCIKRSMKFIGDAFLNSKIGFISVEDWLENPKLAEIRGLNRIKYISELARTN